MKCQTDVRIAHTKLKQMAVFIVQIVKLLLANLLYENMIHRKIIYKATSPL